MQMETAVSRARPRKAALVVVLLAGSTGCGEASESDLTAQGQLQEEASDAVTEADAGAYPAPPRWLKDAGLTLPPPRFPDGTVPDAGTAVRPGSPRDAVGGEVCGPSVPWDGGRPMMFCTGRVFGDSKTCVSLDLLKQLAVAACSSDGLTLADMKAGDECEGGATTGWASCCEAYEGPTPADAGAAPAVCMGLALGGRMTCTPDYELKQIAHDACAARGLALRDFTSGAPCPGGAFDARGSCCPEQGPEPHAGVMCLADYIGDGTTCMDRETLLLKATVACAAQGLALTDLVADESESCPAGATEAKYQCCVSATR